VLLEIGGPLSELAEERLASFAELLKCPEHVHTYRITPLSLWNAAATGLSAGRVLRYLREFARYPVPDAVARMVREQMGRYGQLRLLPGAGGPVLVASDPSLVSEICRDPLVFPYLQEREGADRVAVDPAHRGRLKQAFTRLGYPVIDEAGYEEGEPLQFALRPITRCGKAFALRPYQQAAVDAFWADGGTHGGSGVIVMPCGAGKTVVGLAVMARVQSHTLVLATSVTAVNQWYEEILDRTTLTPDAVGVYTSGVKAVRPVTITTYQMLASRRAGGGRLGHFDLLGRQRWGLIIYDEVHLLPAPVFRVTAELQARRRLGLTATPVREDGREGDVFSLIGPRRFNVPWKLLERQGWIATACCREVRVPLAGEARLTYALSGPRTRFRLAAENPAKLEVVRELVGRHRGERVLIIGQYLRQLEEVARQVRAPIITGKTPEAERQTLYRRFRTGDIGVLVVSRVANYAVDLPEATVAIQVSGTFGSRQEEAQRLGRILRPKRDGTPAHFYTLVTGDSREQYFAAKRQLFLVEQGYRYDIGDGLPGEGKAP